MIRMCRSDHDVFPIYIGITTRALYHFRAILSSVFSQIYLGNFPGMGICRLCTRLISPAMDKTLEKLLESASIVCLSSAKRDVAWLRLEKIAPAAINQVSLRTAVLKAKIGRPQRVGRPAASPLFFSASHCEASRKQDTHPQAGLWRTRLVGHGCHSD